jgi:hypothetical protein
MVVTANLISSSQILVILMMEALSSFDMPVTRATRRNISEDGILQRIRYCCLLALVQFTFLNYIRLFKTLQLRFLLKWLAVIRSGDKKK